MSNPFTVSKHPEQLKTTRLVAQSHDYDDPLPPKDLVFLQSVNEHECVIKSAQINSRLSNTFPMFLVLLVMMFYTLFTFAEEHISKKNTILNDIKLIEHYYSGYSGKDKQLINYIKKYEPYFEKNEISWLEYLKLYYVDGYYSRTENDKYLIIGWLIFFPGFLYVLGSLSFEVTPNSWRTNYWGFLCQSTTEI